MKIFDKDLINFFETDTLTEEIVRNKLKEKTLYLLEDKKNNTKEENILRIEEINKIQEKYPHLLKEIWIVARSEDVGLLSYLNKENWEEISVEYRNASDEKINLEGFNNLKKVNIFGKMPLNNLKIPKNIEKIYYFNALELNNDKGIICGNGVIWIRDVSDLDIEMLGKMQKEYNVKNIAIIKDITCPKDYNGKNTCIDGGTADIYTVDEYKQIVEKLHSLVDGIDNELSEEDKVIKIYKNIAKSVRYDRKAAKDNTKYERENLYSSRSMKNGLLKGKCVCVGYAEIMRNACALIGIEAVKVGSIKQRHAWNKIKINGDWYNFDPTGENVRFYGFLRDEDVYEEGEEVEGPPANKIHERNTEYKIKQREKRTFESYLDFYKKTLELRKNIREFKEKRNEKRNKDSKILLIKHTKFGKKIREIREKFEKIVEKLDKFSEKQIEKGCKTYDITYTLEDSEDDEEKMLSDSNQVEIENTLISNEEDSENAGNNQNDKKMQEILEKEYFEEKSHNKNDTNFNPWLIENYGMSKEEYYENVENNENDKKIEEILEKNKNDKDYTNQNDQISFD